MKHRCKEGILSQVSQCQVLQYGIRWLSDSKIVFVIYKSVQTASKPMSHLHKYEKRKMKKIRLTFIILCWNKTSAEYFFKQM